MRQPDGDEGLLLPFALRDGALIHVDTVSDKDREGFLCPKCQQRVVPRLGSKRRHHFAHHVDHDCHGAYETALHLKAKEILERADRFMVPEASVSWGNETLVICKAQYASYCAVRTEHRFGLTRPDVALIRPGKAAPLLVEVVVSHKAGEEKKQRLQSMSYPCVEVDIGQALSWELFDEALLEEILLHSASADHKRWICIPDEGKYLEELKERVRRQEAEKRRLLGRNHSDPRRRHERIEQARQRRLPRPMSPTPHTDIRVPSEAAFKCQRHVWQGAVYQQFIRRPMSFSNRVDGTSIDIADVELWLHKYYECLIRPSNHDYHGVARAVLEYLEELERMGYVSGRRKSPEMPHHSMFDVIHG